MRKIKWEFKKTWLEFCDWVGYCRDYKRNLEQEETRDCEILEMAKKLKAKDRKIEELKITIETKDNLLEKLELRVVELKEEISNLKKEGK